MTGRLEDWKANWGDKGGVTTGPVVLPETPDTTSPVPGLTSIHATPGRGPYGDPRYRGNCSGLLIRDLLRFYRPGRVLDPMEGSGTCGDVCRELGIRYEGRDLKHGFDATRPEHFEGLGRFDFIWMHPPYFQMVRYNPGDPRCLSSTGERPGLRGGDSRGLQELPRRPRRTREARGTRRRRETRGSLPRAPVSRDERRLGRRAVAGRTGNHPVRARGDLVASKLLGGLHPPGARRVPRARGDRVTSCVGLRGRTGQTSPARSAEARACQPSGLVRSDPLRHCPCDRFRYSFAGVEALSLSRHGLSAVRGLVFVRRGGPGVSRGAKTPGPPSRRKTWVGRGVKSKGRTLGTDAACNSKEKAALWDLICTDSYLATAGSL